MRKRETFAETCPDCHAELPALAGFVGECPKPECRAHRAGRKKYRGNYSLPEYRKAIVAAYHHVQRQLIHGKHEQDRLDAAGWLEDHGPLARNLQTAAIHGIK